MPTSIVIDSRKASAGCLFIALKGKFADGHAFIGKALEKGAAFIAGTDVENGRRDGAVFIKISDGISFMNEICYDFHEEAIGVLDLYGITGTNGKTSSAYFMKRVLDRAGIGCSLIGTVNNIIGGETQPAENTTPYSADLFAMLTLSAERQDRAVSMEVSSHALSEGRVHGLNFKGIIITNITGDHLDYHGSFENYYESKKRIFDHIGKDAPAAVNADCPVAAKLSAELKERNVINFGRKGAIKLTRTEITRTGSSFSYTAGGKKRRCELRMFGDFAVYNALGVLALAYGLGLDLDAAGDAVSSLELVPGRFQIVEKERSLVIVDYAHTHDALEKLLNSVKRIPHGKLITVFGCGGDRDRTKRPKMGRTVSRLSDIAIVTSDNPRTEDPDEIIRDALEGMPDDAVVIPERSEAIREALKMAGSADIVVIAGKGHEDYQIIGREKRHFSDKEEVERFYGRIK